MPLFSSHTSSPTSSLQHLPANKNAGAETIDEFEILSYLTSSDSSGYSSRASSPFFELVTSPASSLADDVEKERADGMIFDYPAIHAFQPMQVGAIDPRLLSAPCDAPDARELLCLRPLSCNATSVPQRLRDVDVEEEDVESNDDEEYLPTEEENRLKKPKSTPSPRKYSSRTAKNLGYTSSRSPSPNTASRCTRYRSRNKPAPTDAVVHELSRIALKRVTVKRRTTGRGNRDSSCRLCGASFTRPSDLHRHVLTHDPSRSKNSAVCIGLSMQQALELNVDLSQLKRCYWKNEQRIGGCGEHFSRTDALLRHVKLKRSQCLLLSEYLWQYPRQVTNYGIETGQLVGHGQ